MTEQHIHTKSRDLAFCHIIPLSPKKKALNIGLLEMFGLSETLQMCGLLYQDTNDM